MRWVFSGDVSDEARRNVRSLGDRVGEVGSRHSGEPRAGGATTNRSRHCLSWHQTRGSLLAATRRLPEAGASGYRSVATALVPVTPTEQRSCLGHVLPPKWPSFAEYLPMI